MRAFYDIWEVQIPKGSPNMKVDYIFQNLLLGRFDGMGAPFQAVHPQTKDRQVATGRQ